MSTVDSEHAARAIALRELEVMVSRGGVPLSINEAQTRDLGDGWLFYHNSAEFLEIGHNLSRLAGNGPIFVLRSGEVHFLPSYQAVEASLAEARENSDRFLRSI